jgi:hypothetical protein
MLMLTGGSRGLKEIVDNLLLVMQQSMVTEKEFLEVQFATTSDEKKRMSTDS